MSRNDREMIEIVEILKLCRVPVSAHVELSAILFFLHNPTFNVFHD